MNSFFETASLTDQSSDVLRSLYHCCVSVEKVYLVILNKSSIIIYLMNCISN